MISVVKKWCDSAAVRIPTAVLDAAHVTLEQPIDIREEGGRIIGPIRPARYDLDALLAGVTDENIHKHIDIGPPAGKELW